MNLQNCGNLPQLLETRIIPCFYFRKEEKKMYGNTFYILAMVEYLIYNKAR